MPSSRAAPIIFMLCGCSALNDNYLENRNLPSPKNPFKGNNIFVLRQCRGALLCAPTASQHFHALRVHLAE